MDNLKASLLKTDLDLHKLKQLFIEVTLEKTKGNKTKAAALLGISIRTLRNYSNAGGSNEKKAESI